MSGVINIVIQLKLIVFEFILFQGYIVISKPNKKDVKSNILFIHQNFPGQYRYLAKHFAAQKEWNVVAVGERECVKRQFHLVPENVTMLGYDMDDIDYGTIPHNARYTSDHIARADALAHLLLRQKKKGLDPDIILAHPGWGEGFYLKELFPRARLIYFFEFFFGSTVESVNFDKEFPGSLGQQLNYRMNSATNLIALDVADVGVCPTHWQLSTYPEAFHSKINVIHDGVDTTVVTPQDTETLLLKGTSLGDVSITKDEELITYSVRNLEPSRGFHRFMRALPKLQALRPNARFVIVGGDDKSYSQSHASGLSWREVMLKEVGDQLAMDRIIFTGKIPYKDLLSLFSMTSLHLYWTTPFVLSWSLMEAMACEAVVLASSTEPVKEVIADGENGFLFDFFSEEDLLRQVDCLLNNSALCDQVAKKARQTVVTRYDLASVCLPQHLSLIEEQLAQLS